MRSRDSFAQALLRATPPTITVLAMTAVVQFGAHTRVLFAPLAASAFLIYHAPHERSNHVGVIVISQLVGAACGLGVAAFGHPGYVSEAIAMLLTISALISFDLLHAPAVPTALIFADAPVAFDNVAFFAIDLAILAALWFAQQAIRRHRQESRIQ